MAQDRYTVSFTKEKTDQELYAWILKKAVILGECKFTKQVLYEKMLEEKDKETEKL
jgi:hypothetical protein